MPQTKQQTIEDLMTRFRGQTFSDSEGVEGFLEEILEEARVMGRMDVTGKTSDGYHTFDELYDHRITLYIALCKIMASRYSTYKNIWRSKLHSDGTSFDGWFILGINKTAGKQITYHLPLERWEETNFAETLEKAPEFDGHTSADVLKRIKEI